MLGPIFTRESITVPRQGGHYLTRVTALGLLWVLGITAWQASVGFENIPTLGRTAWFGLLLFQIITFVELTLLLFFAAVSAAGTVAREKDRRTFVLLLLTDMRDYEIVLGKLLGALLPIFALLLVTVPVLASLLMLGGVSGWQVTQAVLVLAATGLAAGSLGGLVALWRERTFQALALSVLLLVLYLCFAQGIGLLGRLGGVNWVAVQAWVDPFSALRTVLEPPLRGAVVFPPAYGYSLVMLGFSGLINLFGIWKLRVWNPSGEPIMQREKIADVGLGERDQQKDIEDQKHDIHAAPGKVRPVWHNPILWREIRTQAYGKRPVLVKLSFFIAFALICYFALDILSGSGTRIPFAAAYGLVPSVILSLLLVSAQAVTSITSERDGRSLDLLLATDLSPKEFVFGKMGGVVYNAKEFIIPPLLLAAYYAYDGALEIGALVATCGGVLVMTAFVIVLGVHVALRNANSRVAVVNSLGTVFFISVGTLVVIYLIVINGGSFANQWFSFLAFVFIGVGGLWWVLSADRPSPALTLSSILCPLAMFYCVTNILVADPRSQESADPLVPFLVLTGAFGFTISAMLVPMVSEFDVALGRTAMQDE